MGKKVHIDAVRAFIKTTPVFRARDVEVIAGDRRYAHLLLHNMARRGEIVRLTRGFYSLEGDPVLSVFCFRPAYIGLQEALSMRNLWEQETNVVIVTAASARAGVREVAGSNVVVRPIPVTQFFGYEFLPYGEYRVPVSDPEKTLIDLVSLGEASDVESLGELLGAVSGGKVRKYLAAYPAPVRRSVLSLLGT
jgi:predicted transcriptional regulator of viral defense system